MSQQAAADRGRFPGYDVLSKRLGPSWNEQTRASRHAPARDRSEPRFFTAAEFQTVLAMAARIVPQPATRPPIPVAALVDDKLHRGKSDGYRDGGDAARREAWRLGLSALDAEATAAYGGRFHALPTRTRTRCWRACRRAS